MTPAEILEQATVEGVRVMLSSRDKIKVTGDPAAVDRRLPVLRDYKSAILTELQRKFRRATVLTLLQAALTTPYAVYVADETMDPVVVAVIATFGIEIPLKYYDDMELLELVKTRSGEKSANP